MDFASVAFGFEWPRLALWNATLRLRWKTCGWPGRLCWFALIVERVELAEDRARADADSARDDRGANDDIAFQPTTSGEKGPPHRFRQCGGRNYAS